MNGINAFATFAGIMVGILLAVILIKAANRDGRFKTEYDERQEVVRGKGFKYSFYTMIILSGVKICLEAGEIELPIHRAVQAFGFMAICVLVYVTYAIMNDAYFGLNNKIDRYILIFAILAVVQTASAVAQGISGELIVDGILGFGGCSIVCAFLFVWIFALMIIKKATDGKEE